MTTVAMQEVSEAICQVNGRTIMEVINGPDKARLKKAFFDADGDIKPAVEFKVIPHLLDSNESMMTFKGVKDLTLRMYITQLGYLSVDEFNVWGRMIRNTTSNKGCFLYDGSLFQKEVLVYMYFNTRTKMGVVLKVVTGSQAFDLSLKPGPFTSGYEIEEQMNRFGCLLPAKLGDTNNIFNVDLWLNEHYGAGIAYAVRSGKLDVSKVELLYDSEETRAPIGFDIEEFDQDCEGQAFADYPTEETVENHEADEENPTEVGALESEQDEESLDDPEVSTSENKFAEAVKNSDVGSDEDEDSDEDDEDYEGAEDETEANVDDEPEPSNEGHAEAGDEVAVESDADEGSGKEETVNKNGIRQRYGS